MQTAPLLVSKMLQLLEGIPDDKPLLGVAALTADELIQLVRKKICSACHRESPDAKICGRCKLVNYCNDTCQKSHWAAHKVVCKTPCETTLIIEATNPGGPVTRKKVPYAIHRLEDTQQPYARRVGAEAVKAEKYAELNGNFINYLLVDAIYMVQCHFYQRNSTMNTLLTDGYRGLMQAGQQRLAELLNHENYIEILKLVWTEKNSTYKLAWLREKANQGHAILMFETARALAESKNLDDAAILEAFKWRHLGELRTLLDAACFADPTVSRVMESLVPVYSVDHLLTPVPAKKKRSILLQISSQRQKLLADLKVASTDPSPQWLLFSGMKSYQGINTLRNSEEWIACKTMKLTDARRMLEVQNANQD